MVSNPSELRAKLQAIFSASPLVLDGQIFGSDVTDEAIDEIIASMVRSYLREGGPTACEKIVGRLFISLIDRQNDVS